MHVPLFRTSAIGPWRKPTLVIPAQRGIQHFVAAPWTPACARLTGYMSGLQIRYSGASKWREDAGRETTRGSGDSVLQKKGVGDGGTIMGRTLTPPPPTQ